jgi:hypothetical protein
MIQRLIKSASCGRRGHTNRGRKRKAQNQRGAGHPRRRTPTGTQFGGPQPRRGFRP